MPTDTTAYLTASSMAAIYVFLECGCIINVAVHVKPSWNHWGQRHLVFKIICRQQNIKINKIYLKNKKIRLELMTSSKQNKQYTNNTYTIIFIRIFYRSIYSCNLFIYICTYKMYGICFFFQQISTSILRARRRLLQPVFSRPLFVARVLHVHSNLTPRAIINTNLWTMSNESNIMKTQLS